MSAHFRNAALRAVHNSREALASIDVVDDADMALAKLSPAILTAVSPKPVTTSTHDDPDRFFHRDRDLCYLKLIFALAGNTLWHSHLFVDGHIDRCSSIIADSCYFDRYDLQPHAFYLAGIFLRMTSEEVSVTSLNSITEQERWDLMRKACYSAFLTIDNTNCVEFLPILAEETKKSMRIAIRSELRLLIKGVDRVIEMLVKRGLLEQRDGVAVAAMKELRSTAHEKVKSV